MFGGYSAQHRQKFFLTDGDGVGDVRLAALAHLPLMRAVGKAVGAAQLGQIVFGQINGMRLQHGQARLGSLIQRRIGKVLTAGAAVWRQIAFFVVHGVRFNHPHRMCANKKSALKALVPGCGVQETFFSKYVPTVSLYGEQKFIKQEPLIRTNI